MKPRRARTRAVLAAAGIAGWLAATCAGAVELLPPHEAFALSARALNAQTLEVRFDIVDGYYLYRDKLRFAVDAPDAVPVVAELPAGKAKHDEFFGDMQTYRGTVYVPISMGTARAGRVVTLVSESQGCADAGVCYPPQRQTLELEMPQPGTPASAWIAAPIGRPAWLK